MMLTIFILLTALFRVGNCNFSGSEVYTKVLNNHSPLVPPSQNISVTVALDLSSIIDIDTKAQIMTTRLNLHLYWKDSSLGWSQKQFPRMDYIQLTSSRVWTPNIKLWNSVDDTIGVQKGVGGDILVTSTGQVHWSILATFKSSCSVDATFYPFDQQTCALKFGSQDNNVYLSLHNNLGWGNLDNYYPSVIWWVVEVPGYANKYTSAVDSKIVDTDVTFFLTVRRYTFWPTQVYPLLTIAFLTIVPCLVTKLFLKLTLQLICLAGLFFINKDISEVLPPTQLVTPHALKYISALVILNLVHLTLTCILSNFHKDQLQCLAKWVPKEIANKISKFQILLCLRSKKPEKQEIEIENREITNPVEVDEPECKVYLYIVINRFISIGISLAVIIATMHFLLAHPHRGESIEGAL